MTKMQHSTCSTSTTLDTDVLDRVYRNWYTQTGRGTVNQYTNYQRFRRLCPTGQAFENWLYDQGFVVIQRNKKRYLSYSGDGRALTLFLLRYT
jgi:hypothetical protein